MDNGKAADELLHLVREIGNEVRQGNYSRAAFLAEYIDRLDALMCSGFQPGAWRETEDHLSAI